MRLILFFIAGLFNLIMACKSTQKATEEPILQGITGTVQQVTGNQMPRIGAPPASPKPFPTTVFFYEPTNVTQINQNGQSPLYTAIYTRMVASVETDSTGSFTAKLPVGTYSVFVQVGKNFFANSFDIRNNISLVTVEADKLTEVKILVDNYASY